MNILLNLLLMCVIVITLFTPMFSGYNTFEEINGDRRKDQCDNTCKKLNATLCIYEDSLLRNNCVCIINSTSVKLW